MAAAGVITVSGSVTGIPTGSITFAGSITSSAAVGEVLSIVLASGDNTISVPSGTTTVYFQPPVGNAIALKLKGAGGDTGVTISKVNLSIFSLDASQTSLIINAGSAFSAATYIAFL
jgi:hypothetical protein